MTLPIGFKTSYEYFQHVVDFLKENSWIYRESNTGFLKAGILNEMPQEYKDYFLVIPNEELNRFPYVHQALPNLKDASLRNFRHRLAKLIPLEAYAEPKHAEKEIQIGNLKKISLKKQHEIQRLAAVVQENLKTNKRDHKKAQEKWVVIDFGSGLGYLSEILYKLHDDILIVGLESDPYRVQAAEKRVKTFMPTAANCIQYRQHLITENSKEFIQQTATELLKLNYQHGLQHITTKMAIIGLHACADLTITSMQLFFQLPQVHHLIIMPCCYHKLQVSDGAVLKFKHFPMSRSLQQALLEKDKASTSFLNRPFLRLACQQTLKRWNKYSQEQHREHGMEMFLRAVAELIKSNEQVTDLIVVKNKMDLSSLSAEEVESFETFSRIYSLKRKATNEFVTWSISHREKFTEIMEKYPNGCKLAEGLTCLQTTMQKLCENLVLWDRLCYMEETALRMNLKINVRYEKILDEQLSPRCYVLIAEKL